MSTSTANPNFLKGKTVLITGGTKNLGRETAIEFSKLQANLFIHYRSTPHPTQLEHFADVLSKAGSKVEFYQSDLTSAKDVHKMFSTAKEKFPNGIDIAINNIGKVLKKPLVEVSEEEFDGMDLVNNKIAFFFIQEAGKSLNENGKIISLVTSLLAAYTPFYSSYQGTKAPVEYYSKAASKELQQKGISVNCIAPGPMDTPFLYGQEKNKDISYYKTMGLHGRLTETHDIVPIIRFLAYEGSWITGQTIYASGGFTAH
ncbi:hypothetical protein DASC09_035740 [Saccharomycopsis crataegensis]|uniref:Short chain dehydrogenase n=1 Tax=Saccharomycopsis crataegensis TaxID=43959 RepID=A0AAV5QND8_9ASCO|nr:hypothetical protein DASC09_035740 [Saccharomycopsis crataegensis]